MHCGVVSKICGERLRKGGLPFIVAPGAGAVVSNVVHVIDALTSPAFRTSLLAMILGDMTEKTLFVVGLKRMLWYPEIEVSLLGVLFVKLALLFELRKT
jgi:hypothetical protein